MDEQFFSRTTTWYRVGDRITAHDSKSPLAPRLVTMEPWYEVVFLAADGETRVRDFVAHLGEQYEGGIPGGLRAQIHEIIGALVGEGLLALHHDLRPLPPYLAEDYLAEPPETRKLQMERDGFIGPGPDR